jgi:hypothetical protein
MNEVKPSIEGLMALVEKFGEREYARDLDGAMDLRFEIEAYAAALSSSPSEDGGEPRSRALPHPGSPEASAMMDSLLAEYQYPANTKNAARAGWEAANRWLTHVAASPPQQGTGDADGVLGTVTLADGSLWTPADQAWADKAMAEQSEQFRREAEDDEAMRKALAGTIPCPNCSGSGFDAEPDGFGGAIGGRCGECNGGGRVPDGVPASCEWQEEDPDFMPGTYRSACGELWAFTDGGVKENHVRFCQGCGKPVHVVERPAEPEDADGVGGNDGR